MCHILCDDKSMNMVGNFIFSSIKYAIPTPIRTVPIPFPISSPNLLPFPWKCHGNPMGMGCTPLLCSSSLGVHLLANRACCWLEGWTAAASVCQCQCPTWWPPCRIIQVALSLQRRKVWLTPTTRVPCSNVAKTRETRWNLPGCPNSSTDLSR